MAQNRYALAGWASILSSAGTLTMLGLSFAFELSGIAEGTSWPRPPWSHAQAVSVAAVDLVAWGLGIYALVRFRDLLRERYEFHAIDHLIWVVIGAGLVVAVVSHAHRLAAVDSLGGALRGVAFLAALGVLNGIVGIVFATRLFRVNGTLNGYKKPLAWVYLAGSICFLLVIPSVIGVVLLASWGVLLGLAFFHGEDLEELEVV